MTDLTSTLETYVQSGSVPGAVAMLARGGQAEVHTAGSLSLDGGAPMARDTIFRIASITKPIAAAAAMLLVEEGRIQLDDPVTGWLPELSAPWWSAPPAFESAAGGLLGTADDWLRFARMLLADGEVSSTGTVAILLTQAGVTSPDPYPLLLDFWRCAAAF